MLEKGLLWLEVLSILGILTGSRAPVHCIASGPRHLCRLKLSLDLNPKCGEPAPGGSPSQLVWHDPSISNLIMHSPQPGATHNTKNMHLTILALWYHV